MKKNTQGKGKRVFLLVLLTLFFISFSASAFIIINANKLVFVDDIEEYKSITEGLKDNEDKDQIIIDLTEQVERYKNMYESLSDENKGLARTNESLNSKISELEKKLNSYKAADKENDKEETDEKKDEDTTKKPTDTSETKKTNSTSKSTSTTKNTSTTKKE